MRPTGIPAELEESLANPVTYEEGQYWKTESDGTKVLYNKDGSKADHQPPSTAKDIIKDIFTRTPAPVIEFEGQTWKEVDGEEVLMNGDGTKASDNPDTDPTKVSERIKELESKLKTAKEEEKQSI